MNERETLDLLREKGAVLDGHFLLTSGRHSPTYVEKARIFEHPAAVERLAAEVAAWHGGVEAVVSPAVGAIPFGFAVALAAGSRFLYAERQDGAMTLRRGFSLRAGERVLVVEDVVTTGGSAAEVAALVRDSGAELLGVAALVDRSDGTTGLPLRALVRIEAQTYAPEECPLCRDGRPLESHGSRHLA